MDPKDPMITIWLAVTDSDDENGCVRIIPGTHHDPWHEQVEGNRGDDVIFGRTIPGYETPGEEPRAVSMILKVRAVLLPLPPLPAPRLTVALVAAGGLCLCPFVSLRARIGGQHVRSAAVWAHHLVHASRRPAVGAERAAARGVRL